MIRSAQQRIRVGQIGQVLDLAARPKQLRPADSLVHRLEGIARGGEADEPDEQVEEVIACTSLRSCSSP